MSLWGWVLLACAIAFVTKFIGHVLPREWLERPRIQVVMSGMTIGLLTGLIVNNTVGDGTRLVLDARILAFIAAIIALRLRAPFIVVVVAGAATAALARLLGMA